ncbi:hypothetical protein BDB00DRAFT_805912 [Zychaea mexicana]|uniref:uncharacterized protein n=1 Tax=Zychaea mexicana TaxID=64656 RepID=UPI0022FDF02B|nr:uncharacterized protein BDB00DRAFT_805912 [Zychaea mexicana]KAI9497307.1 hypothetical protein BDB00DRAFT_805912 [Zychaea mexicana]
MSPESPMPSNDELATALLQPSSPEDYSDSNDIASPPSQQPSLGQQQPQSQQPVKVRKKPGRKPNPASPALRKAQNRAAQRAFRERKERHLRELETAVKQIREQRDKLQAENEQFRQDSDILRSENWYLKGIVLTLQLVCFRHNLVIPSHSPYMNEEALSLLAQSIPEPIAAYLSANANNKLPIPSRLFDYSPSKPRDRYLSQGSLFVTKDGISNQAPTEFENFPSVTSNSSSSSSRSSSSSHTDDLASELPALSPVSEDEVPLPSPPAALEEPITSNLAAIQILRLRLRLQSACAQMDSTPFAIQPTVLQLTIPHDPRIDLIPTPHMRDRMILFRDLFDLDDCFRCLIGNSVFHGGDPALASNWQLPPEFFDKFWFLTIDFSLQRTTNRWRRLQGLKELQPSDEKREMPPAIAAALANMPQLSSALNSFPPPASLNRNSSNTHSNSNSRNNNNNNHNYASSLASDTSSSGESDSTMFFASPVQLTNGYMPTSQPQDKDTDFLMDTSTCHPWDTMLSPSENDYDMIMDSLIDSDKS